MTSPPWIVKSIQAHYAEIARTRDSPTSRGPYTAAELATVPRGALLELGTGAPVRHADPQPGEVVLDLGAGAGIDVFLASRAVGPRGRAIGVDITPDMVRRANANAKEGGYTNVEFHEAPIERLPIADASVDVIVSNCVINLSIDKDRVLAEAARVLKKGGRFVVSDMLRLGPKPDDATPSCDCTSGALSPHEWERYLTAAGFRSVTVTLEGTADACCGSNAGLGRGIIRATMGA